MTHQSALAIAGTLGIMIAAASAQEQSKYPNWSGQWTWVPDGGQPRYDMSKPLAQTGSPAQAGVPDALRGQHQGSG